jgi:DNA-binding beta-propeller fold protein YncE
MAFRRDALLSIGGFNPTYLRAGDDVDVCWRLQAKGLQIGFAGAALVWHHHRTTVEAFWRQQVGYGEGEAWLHVHHPDKFSRGGMLWHGRIYSSLPFVRSFNTRRVNTGIWGTAAFPSVYATDAHPLQFLPHSATWMALSSALLVIGGLAVPDPSRGGAWLLAAGIAGWLTTLIRCVMFARRSDLNGLPPIAGLPRAASRMIYRATIAWLHLLQPLARMRGRLQGMWSLPQAGAAEHTTRQHSKAPAPSLRDARASGQLLTGAGAERSFWSEAWVNHPRLLATLAAALRSSHPAHVVELDDGWHADRDVSVAVGRWAWLHAKVLVEEHAEGRCLLRTAVRVRPSSAGVVFGFASIVLVAGAASLAGALRVPALGIMSVAAALALLARAAWQTTRAVALFDRALQQATAATGLSPLRVPPAVPARRSRRLVPVRIARVGQAAVLGLTVAGAAAGGLWIGREATATHMTPATGFAAGDSEVEATGGVAIGIAGDVFVADAYRDVIRRLRPRPPLDAVWTASDIGTDGPPLLGHSVPFDAAADIALAPNGDLYVADVRRHRIRRVVRSSGQIVTVAGTGTAGFAGDGGRALGATLHGPSAVAVAPNGDLYIADTLNDRIRVIAHETGIIATIAGDGRIGIDRNVGDAGPALRAHLNRPSGLAVAANGDLYVADTGHNRVRMIDARTGVITTVAGNGIGGFAGDEGPATEARLAAPMGLALASRDEGTIVYVADSLNDCVRVIDGDGRIATLQGGGPVIAPSRLAYHPAGWLYVKDASPDGVTAVATSKRPPVESASAPAGHTHKPRRNAERAAGNLT